MNLTFKIPVQWRKKFIIINGQLKYNTNFYLSCNQFI